MIQLRNCPRRYRAAEHGFNLNCGYHCGPAPTGTEKVGWRFLAHLPALSLPHFLTGIPVESIEVDTCPRCHGVWLDQGEMEHILQLHRVRAERKQPSTANKVADATATGADAIGDVGLAAADVGLLGEIGEAGIAVVEFFGGLF